METSNLVKKIPNPTGKGGFQERPEQINRSGHWKPENTISYQYNRFINMTPDELRAWIETPNDQKTMAMVLAYRRVMAASDSLQDMKEITDRTEGRAAVSIDLSTTGEITHKFEELDDDELDRIIKARQDRIS